MNYNPSENLAQIAIDADHLTIQDGKVVIDTNYITIENLNVKSSTIKKLKTIYEKVGTDIIFGRSDIKAIINNSETTAGNLITILKNAGLIKTINEHGKGKYKFIKPQT